MNSPEVVDITPSPRILRVLGEIPFSIWQCFAELMDNSIDALLKLPDSADKHKSVYVSWSSKSVPDREKTIEVIDNANGMTLEQMQNAARAGYSNNNPIGNLGLFGMGFNIATARLGGKTTIWSTTEQSDRWYGIEIDFDELAKGNNFQAPVLYEAKSVTDSASGTKIVISNLKSGTASSLYQQETEIRRTLENVYAPLLSESNIDLYIQNKVLHPKRPCIWSSDRYVNYKGLKVPAVIPIDKQLGAELFDIERNSYLSFDEQANYQGLSEEELPDNICYRERHLYGWLGIQRYFHTDDFGIDFIRNGRKILMNDKSLFSYKNPYTGESTIQYPVELGSTTGGRIVGQLHVDYLLPTYQKNDFDRYDSTWYDTVSILCGEGPFLPKARKALGLEELPDSPLGLLVNAFRRPDPGTKNLSLPRRLAIEFNSEFRKGNPDYISDEKWWKAAQECDQEKQSGATPPANAGDTPTDNPDDIFGIGGSDLTGPAKGSSSNSNPSNNGQSLDCKTSKKDELIRQSDHYAKLSGSFQVGSSNPINVASYRLKSGEILRDGKRVPCAFFPKGMECDFFFDPYHEILNQYPIQPGLLLNLYLAERFKKRDQLDDLGDVYASLIRSYMLDERIDRFSLAERAEYFFINLREGMKPLLASCSEKVVECIHESSGETEEAIERAISAGVEFSEIDPMGEAAFNLYDYVPDRTLYRLVDLFPEYLFDGQLFKSSYQSIVLKDKQAEARLRTESKDRLLSYIKDLLYLLSTPASSISKNDLTRIASSLDILSDKLVGE